MNRIPTPPDLNHTTRRFARTLDEAFLCDAERAQAFFKDLDVCHYGARWWSALTLCAVLGIIVIAATA